MELTIEQQRAVAIARARARAAAEQPDASGTSPANAANQWPTDGGPLEITITPPKPERGSVLDPIVSGFTFGWGDEIAGAFGGAMDWMGLGPKGSEGTFTEGYDRTAAKARRNLDEYSERNPVTSTVAEIGGAVATLPVAGPLNILRAPAAVSKAAPLAARVGNATARGSTAVANSAATGAAYGGVYGAGAADGDIGDRALGAVEGAAMGGALGAAAPAAVGAGRAALNATIGKPVRALKNAAGPRRQAERMMVDAARKDSAAAGRSLDDTALGLEIMDSQGIPMRPLDTGATTRDLGRSAVGVSPQGKDTLNQMINSRYETQADRVIDTATRYAPGVNAPSKRKFLEQAARAANKPRYDKAYLEGEAGIWHGGLKQLTLAPAMQTAIRDAGKTGANKAAVEGARPPKNPFVFDADGTMSMVPGIRPNLRFWDAVKQNLDDQYDRASRAGDKGAARDVLAIKRQLVDHLDAAVPSYADARGTAATFFGAENALDAGKAFVRRAGDNEGAREALAKMNTSERALFGEGFATQLIEDLRNIPDRQTVVNKIMQSPAARERFELALGKQAAREMEATIQIESIMDLGRAAIQGGAIDRQRDVMNALTQITTQAGIGGGVGLWASNGVPDAKTFLVAGLVVGGLRGGRALAGKMSAAGNEAVARELAEMLSSNDPQAFRRAVERIGRNPRFAEALRTGHDRLTRALLPLVSQKGGTVPAIAEDGSQPAAADGEGN